MKSLTRFAIASGAVFLFLSACPFVLAQGGKGAGSPTDISGTWRKIGQEDTHERGTGPDPGEYWGLPLNDAARMRGDTYNEEWVSTSYILQCRPHPTGYQPLGPDPMRIEQMTNPINRQLIAYRISYDETPGDRMVWLDGRPGLSPLAVHTWEGFSKGHFKGDTLIIESTHMKEAFHRRNGVPSSFRATTIEHVSLDEPYLTWVVTTYDDDYLTEPVVRSATYIRAPNVQIPPYPCAAQQEEIGADADNYRVPNYFMGENQWLTEVAVKYKVSLEGVRGGAATTYPEWRAKGALLKPPTAEYTLKPTYTDASTKIAERAAAQPKRPPTYDKVESLHAGGNVYVIAGAGGNIAASVGGDGVLLVDAGAEQAVPKVIAAINAITKETRPPDRPDSASPFADTWQATHAFPSTAIRTIINTSSLPDHVGGNAKIRDSAEFHALGVLGAEEQGSEVILAQENAAKRMGEEGLPDDGIPTNTFFSVRYNMHRFFNDQAVQVTHMPNAVTDGDSIVFFRKSDVIATGDIYIADQYPPIDVDKGGSINGEITALDKIFDMCVTEFMSQGGTMIIPGHGWLGDAADLGYYRDMLTVIRERIQKMVDEKMTLAQVLAAKPTMDYDPEYGREPGVTAKFVEAVYKSLTAPKQGK